MKFAILHHDLEWTEKEIQKTIREKFGEEAELFDIRTTKTKNIERFQPDLILNRVYASVGNRDYPALKKNLRLLKKLEKKGFKIINSFKATKSDYSKYYSFRLMKNIVKTPKTVVYRGKISKRQIKKLGGFPIIVKKDSGGRGIGLMKCDSIEEIEKAIENIKSSKNYSGKIILQEFAKAIEKNDYRVWVVGGKVLFYHKRSLISLNEKEEPWLASRSLGSEIQSPEREIPEDLREFAERAATNIQAELDVLDIVKTNDGYVVIEHNPTPNLRSEYEEILGFNLVERFLDKIIREPQ